MGNHVVVAPSCGASGLFFVHFDLVDLFLDKLKGGEEDCVDEAGAHHGDAEACCCVSSGARCESVSLIGCTSIHASVEELNLGRLGLGTAGCEYVALVDGLCGINGVDLRVEFGQRLSLIEMLRIAMTYACPTD